MKKKLGVLALLFVLFGGSALAFAYWDNLEQTNNVTIPVGSGVTLEVDLATQTTGSLVPSTVVLKPGDVTEVVITYNVELDLEIIGSLDLEVVVSNVQIGGSSDHAGLVSAIVSNPGSIANDTVTVTVTVTLTEPADQATYEAIANESITFDVTFTATQPE